LSGYFAQLLRYMIAFDAQHTISTPPLNRSYKPCI